MTPADADLATSLEVDKPGDVDIGFDCVPVRLDIRTGSRADDGRADDGEAVVVAVPDRTARGCPVRYGRADVVTVDDRGLAARTDALAGGARAGAARTRSRI